MKTKTVIRLFGAALALFSTMVGFWLWGYRTGYGDAARNQTVSGVELVVIMFLLLGLFLLFIGLLPVKWTDEEPTKG